MALLTSHFNSCTLHVGYTFPSDSSSMYHHIYDTCSLLVEICIGYFLDHRGTVMLILIGSIRYKSDALILIALFTIRPIKWQITFSAMISFGMDDDNVAEPLQEISYLLKIGTTKLTVSAEDWSTFNKWCGAALEEISRKLCLEEKTDEQLG